MAVEVIKVWKAFSECSLLSREGSSSPGTGYCPLEIASESRNCSLDLSKCWAEGLKKIAKGLFARRLYLGFLVWRRILCDLLSPSLRNYLWILGGRQHLGYCDSQVC